MGSAPNASPVTELHFSLELPDRWIQAQSERTSSRKPLLMMSRSASLATPRYQHHEGDNKEQWEICWPPWTCLHESGELVVSQPTIMGR
jgi:hypothetical protein